MSCDDPLKPLRNLRIPPDSGEREVRHVVAVAFEYCRVDGEVAVHVSLPLAQRILAALEGKVTQEGYEESAALAAELRAVMPK